MEQKHLCATPTPTRRLYSSGKCGRRVKQKLLLQKKDVVKKNHHGDQFGGKDKLRTEAEISAAASSLLTVVGT